MKWPLDWMAATALMLAASAALADAPQSTTATYQDWVVRCVVRTTGKLCEMTQSTQIKGRAQPLTQIAIGRQSKNGPVKIVFLVPVNVWLPSGIKLVTENKKTAVNAGFNRCVPQGCFAASALGDDTIKKLRGQKNNGTLQFKNAQQRAVGIPVSFKGFGAAYDAIGKP